MSRVVNTNTNNPAHRGLDPNFKYVKVQRNGETWKESPIASYLSPIDPEHPRYEVAPGKEGVHPDQELLRTPMAEYLRYEKAVTERAARNLTPKNADNEAAGGDVIGSFTEFNTADGDVLKA